MQRRLRLVFHLVLLTLVFTHLNAQIKLSKPGVEIKTSTQVIKGDYFLPGNADKEASIIITGNDITVDFNGAVLSGNKKPSEPNQFQGVAILVSGGNNITIMNANVKGYKMAILAQNVHNLKILNCDFSYNYRPKLYSQREYEDFADWLSFHHNDNGEWKNYGAAVYMEACDDAVVKGIKIVQGFNGVMLSNCNRCLLYNNNVQYNSGVGMALYRSSDNKIMHNQLSWNVRGYSAGFYSRGQDSAGILVYEQSSNNIFAYNTATHSGDGFFLWAGQSTMDSGQGGCNDNMVYGNDFSYSPTNGVELTFSRNIVYNNIISGCENGIWGGYSYSTLIFANKFQGNKRDIAIEHGQDNSIRMNLFYNSILGIDLWQNKDRLDWGYTKAKDVTSRNYDIQRNKFSEVQTPFSVHSSRDVRINYNQVVSANEVLREKFPNNNLSFNGNDIQGTSNWGAAEKWKEQNKNTISTSAMELPKEYINRLIIPARLEDGIIIDQDQKHKREDIIINEWGPYNFQYPFIHLYDKKNETYTFQLYGPPGKWKLLNLHGLAINGSEGGSAPMGITAMQKWKDIEDTEILIEWTGEAFTDQFGQYHPAGEPIQLSCSIFNPAMKWRMGFYNVPKEKDLLNFVNASEILKTLPVKKDTVNELRFAWWNPPFKEINSEKYLTLSETKKAFEQGTYNIYLTSDDGVVLYVDNKEIFRNWNVHESATDKITLQLKGEHSFKIVHYNESGFANIQFRMERTK